EDQDRRVGIVLRECHQLRRRNHIKYRVPAGPGTDRNGSSSVIRRRTHGVTSIERLIWNGSAGRAHILVAADIASRAGAVRGEFAGENRHAKRRWIRRRAGVGPFHDAIGEWPVSLRFTKAKQNITVRNEEERLIRARQVRHQRVSSERYGCPPIA